jgi:protein TonB
MPPKPAAAPPPPPTPVQQAEVQPAPSQATVGPASGAGMAAAGNTGTGAAGANVGRGDAGTGQGTLGEGAEGPGDEYLERLYRWIRKYARDFKRDASGKVWLAITIGRDGTVLNASVDETSGNPMLDRTALELIHRASPVPPLPPTYRADRVTVFMPVDFSNSIIQRLFGRR